MNKWLRDNELNQETDPDYDGFCYILGDFSEPKD